MTARSFTAVVLTLTVFSACKKSPPATASTPAPPALTILIVIDQLRGDELAEHGELFRGGLARMMKQGRWYTEALQPHARTETASGHATISTGMLPRDHGVVSKSMYDTVRGELFSVCDYRLGMCAPDALLTPTLGDRLRAVHPSSNIIAIGQKPRSAVLLGGRQADVVAWIDHEQMRLTGRARKGDTVLPWLQRSFAQLASRDRVARLWEAPRLPKRYAGWADDVSDEVDVGSGTVFPHHLPDPHQHPGKYYWGWFASPDSDRVLLQTATELLDQSELGRDEVPDLLLIAAGGFDAMGHSFGPDSLERLSALIELDRELGDFLAAVEGRFGHRALVALTSDHGVGMVPSHAKARGHSGARVKAEVLTDAVNDALSAKWGPAKYVRALAFPFLALEPLGDRGPEAARIAAAALQELSVVRRALPSADLRGDSDEQLVRLLWASAHPERAADVAIVLEPHHALWTKWREHGGAEHGTPWRYDRHVPIIVWGAGVKPGRVTTPVSAIDLTRTLGDRMSVPPDPRGGKPLP